MIADVTRGTGIAELVGSLGFYVGLAVAIVCVVVWVRRKNKGK